MDFNDDFIEKCMSTATSGHDVSGRQSVKMAMAAGLLKEILKIRRENGWSHAYMMNKLGVSRLSIVTKIENSMVSGEMPTWKMLHRYADALQRDVEIKISPVAGGNNIAEDDAARLAGKLGGKLIGKGDDGTYRIKPNPAGRWVTWGAVERVARELNSEIAVTLLKREG